MKKTLAIVGICVALLAIGVQAVCNDCVMQVIPVTNSVCQGEPVVYDLKIANAYALSKAITLSAAGDVPLATSMPSQIILAPYENAVLRVNFTPVQPVLGQHRIRVTASGYGAGDSDDTLFIVNDCYGTAVSAPEEFETAPAAPQEPAKPVAPQEQVNETKKSPTGAATAFANSLIFIGAALIATPFVLLSVFVLVKRRSAGASGLSFPEVGGNSRADNAKRLADIKEAISRTEN